MAIKSSRPNERVVPADFYFPPRTEGLVHEATPDISDLPDGSDEETIEAAFPDDLELGDAVLQPPTILGITQTVKTAANGQQVVDVLVYILDAEGATDYNVRLSIN